MKVEPTDQGIAIRLDPREAVHFGIILSAAGRVAMPSFDVETLRVDLLREVDRRFLIKEASDATPERRADPRGADTPKAPYRPKKKARRAVEAGEEPEEAPAEEAAGGVTCWLCRGSGYEQTDHGGGVVGSIPCCECDGTGKC